MIKCIKWLRRIIIAGFVFMISVYSISYIIEAPDLNGGHIIRMYDQNQQHNKSAGFHHVHQENYRFFVCQLPS